MVTVKQIRAIMPLSGGRATIFCDPLNAAMEEFGINTPARQSAFLAQIAHESGQLRYVREIASGADYDTGRLAARLGNTPEADGDGQKYKGRGLIQITGKTNYRAASRALFGDDRLLSDPSTLEETEHACRSAAWFWQSHGLNEIADNGNFERITRIINGGLNGQQDRVEYYARANHAMGVSA